MMLMLVQNLLDLASIKGDTYAKLVPLLESIFVVNWPYQFFDIESRCIINYKLEGLNMVFSNVYIMPLVDPNLESRKNMCVVDLDFVSNSQQTLECIAKEAKIQYLTLLTNNCLHLVVPKLVVRATTHVDLT